VVTLSAAKSAPAPYNAIATLSKRAYGYRNLTNLRTALLFHLGGLNLYPVLPATHAIGR